MLFAINPSIRGQVFELGSVGAGPDQAGKLGQYVRQDASALADGGDLFVGFEVDHKAATGSV